MSTDSPWRVPDFRVLITATALGQLATNTAYVGVPVLAVAALDAGPGQVGALAALSTAAFLLVGLPAGAWVDRIRHRRVLIAADLVRAGTFATVPFAWWLDVLSLPHLYAVVLLAGFATVFADVGAQSALPQLVGRERLIPANAAIVSLISVGNVAGRGAGGGLIQLLTAPIAMACTALGYLASALRLTGLRRAPVRPAPAVGSPLRAQIREGVRHVLGNAELRALALTAALANVGSQIVNTVLPLIFLSELDYSAATLGLFWAAGGTGLLLGARCAGPVATRLGHGRTLAIAGLCLGPAALLVPLVGHGGWLWLAGTGWLLAMFKIGMDNVLGVSLRQRMTPDPLLGRMNATFRFLLTGALAVGAAIAGVLGALTSVRLTAWTGAAVIALAFLPVFLSPLRHRRELPEQAENPVSA
ncbi:MFS transporter [Streptomyces sp. AJS327]|uniref:MFS transporter n=1 Tax=Streptomyces sp. AJS327 TaxID=2545265 RepID=UPI0015DECDFA|nr:MFS transporter [Streptomyces sp. AJS327]MBA0053694.1 MFS transporter [Streptomyces sp. AJS327]